MRGVGEAGWVTGDRPQGGDVAVRLFPSLAGLRSARGRGAARKGGGVGSRCRRLPLLFLLLVPTLASAQGLAPRYAHSVTALPDGRVLVVGGLGPGDAFIGRAEILDPAHRTVMVAPRPAKHRAFHTATLLLDGTVLIAGGFMLPYSTSRTAELWDGSRFVFLESKMSVPRELHAATLLRDGRVLITGGFVGGVTSVASCDLYDPKTRSFHPTGDMLAGRYGHEASLLADGRVLVTGGMQFPSNRTLAEAELYDPATGRFIPAGHMLTDRSRHTATVLQDGRVFITGGNSIQAGKQLRSTEFYDPHTGRFAPGPDMAEPRMDHTAALLPDGKVLIAGGFNGDGGPHTVASCEVFDPATNAFQPARPLAHPVHEHRAALLTSGEVLISGGLEVRGSERRVWPDVVVMGE